MARAIGAQPAASLARNPRLTALTTAFSEAVTMLGSMPTPKRGVARPVWAKYHSAISGNRKEWGMQRLAALLVLGGALAAAPAFAQERLGNSQCAVAPPKFALSSANRVVGKALDGLFRGKAVEVLRPLDPDVNPRLRAWGKRSMTWTWRADGSLHIRCEIAVSRRRRQERL